MQRVGQQLEGLEADTREMQAQIAAYEDDVAKQAMKCRQAERHRAVHERLAPSALCAEGGGADAPGAPDCVVQLEGENEALQWRLFRLEECLRRDADLLRSLSAADRRPSQCCEPARGDHASALPGGAAADGQDSRCPEPAGHEPGGEEKAGAALAVEFSEDLATESASPVAQADGPDEAQWSSVAEAHDSAPDGIEQPTEDPSAVEAAGGEVLKAMLECSGADLTPEKREPASARRREEIDSLRERLNLSPNSRRSRERQGTQSGSRSRRGLYYHYYCYYRYY